MKKSSFCFAYSITSEWSSTPWFTPKGPERFQNRNAFRPRARTLTPRFYLSTETCRTRYVWSQRSTGLTAKGTTGPRQPLNTQAASAQHLRTLTSLSSGFHSSAKPEPACSLPFKLLFEKDKKAKVWNQEFKILLKNWRRNMYLQMKLDTGLFSIKSPPNTQMWTF